MGLIGLILSGGRFDFMNIVMYILSSLVVIFLTMPIHEFAHGFTAYKLGDPTPRYQGRLTLNPFAHIDYIGALLILFIGIGYAKPVQVNMNNFKNPKRGMAITAAAGPIANLIVAFTSLLLQNLLTVFLPEALGYGLMLPSLFLWYIAYINIYLAVFNLIPIPPFDGSRILSAVLPYKYYYAIMRYEQYIFWGLLALIYTGVLDAPIDGAVDFVMTFLARLASILFGIIGG